MLEITELLLETQLGLPGRPLGEVDRDLAHVSHAALGHQLDADLVAERSEPLAALEGVALQREKSTHRIADVPGERPRQQRGQARVDLPEHAPLFPRTSSRHVARTDDELGFAPLDWRDE